MYQEICNQVGTPTYVYDLERIRQNIDRIQTAFRELSPHIHYSAKANANLTVLKAILACGVGIDAVSGGEIYRALQAGASPQQIVFAGVGKTPHEIQFALEQGIAWFNVENIEELSHIQHLATQLGRDKVQIALRLNPDVTADTHPHIATGHGEAKFGLTQQVVRQVLDEQVRYPALNFRGLHVHIGSQLHDIQATCQAIQKAVDLAKDYPNIDTINIGGGLPVAYQPDENLPQYVDFAHALKPILQGYQVLIEPGRSIVADAGVLLARVLYIKQQAGKTFVITDASMTELIRPALYDAYHAVLPLVDKARSSQLVTVTGPVCETTDILAKDRLLPMMQPGDLVVIQTAGAYGMVMASHYNARPRPAEVAVEKGHWWVIRRRETWQDLLADEANYLK
ncbi:MAG: diaminopimelate decarboxylase [Phototrophicales bacterium]|nr:MAG: diaminopimelate decarboxylase [Phototrophicales bacterium]RMG77426.1 MAG: diaminopimelate decarboxylase [Chloroflexota bacterium]